MNQSKSALVLAFFLMLSSYGMAATFTPGLSAIDDDGTSTVICTGFDISTPNEYICEIESLGFSDALLTINKADVAAFWDYLENRPDQPFDKVTIRLSDGMDLTIIDDTDTIHLPSLSNYNPTNTEFNLEIIYNGPSCPGSLCSTILFSGLPTLEFRGLDNITVDAGGVTDAAGIQVQGSGAMRILSINDLSGNLEVKDGGHIIFVLEGENGPLHAANIEIGSGSHISGIKGGLVVEGDFTLTESRINFGGTAIINGSVNLTNSRISCILSPNCSLNVQDDITIDGSLNYFGTTYALQFFEKITTSSGNMTLLNGALINNLNSASAADAGIDIAGDLIMSNSSIIYSNPAKLKSGGNMDLRGRSGYVTIINPSAIEVGGNFRLDEANGKGGYILNLGAGGITVAGAAGQDSFVMRESQIRMTAPAPIILSNGNMKIMSNYNQTSLYRPGNITVSNGNFDLRPGIDGVYFYDMDGDLFVNGDASITDSLIRIDEDSEAGNINVTGNLGLSGIHSGWTPSSTTFIDATLLKVNEINAGSISIEDGAILDLVMGNITIENGMNMENSKIRFEQPKDITIADGGLTITSSSSGQELSGPGNIDVQNGSITISRDSTVTTGQPEAVSDLRGKIMAKNDIEISDVKITAFSSSGVQVSGGIESTAGKITLSNAVVEIQNGDVKADGDITITNVLIKGEPMLNLQSISGNIIADHVQIRALTGNITAGGKIILSSGSIFNPDRNPANPIGNLTAASLSLIEGSSLYIVAGDITLDNYLKMEDSSIYFYGPAGDPRTITVNDNGATGPNSGNAVSITGGKNESQTLDPVAIYAYDAPIEIINNNQSDQTILTATGFEASLNGQSTINIFSCEFDAISDTLFDGSLFTVNRKKLDSITGTILKYLTREPYSETTWPSCSGAPPPAGPTCDLLTINPSTYSTLDSMSLDVTAIFSEMDGGTATITLPCGSDTRIISGGEVTATCTFTPDGSNYQIAVSGADGASTVPCETKTLTFTGSKACTNLTLSPTEYTGTGQVNVTVTAEFDNMDGGIATFSCGGGSLPTDTITSGSATATCPFDLPGTYDVEALGDLSGTVHCPVREFIYSAPPAGAEGITVSVEVSPGSFSKGSVPITYKIVVLNSEANDITVKVFSKLVNAVTRAEIYSYPPGFLTIGSGSSNEYNLDPTFLFSLANLEPGNYRIEAEVTNISASQTLGSASKNFSVLPASASFAIPEFSLLLLPLIVGIVLFAIRRS